MDIAKTRIGFAPVDLVAESFRFFPGNLLAPLNEPRTKGAPDDSSLESFKLVPGSVFPVSACCHALTLLRNSMRYVSNAGAFSRLLMCAAYGMI